MWLLGSVTFLMSTTELIVAGLLPNVAQALSITQAQAGLLITVFAAGMTLGAPIMSIATLRLPRRATLVSALLVFAAAHVVVALSTDFTVVLLSRFVAAVCTGTFWAIGSVVAAAAAGPRASARAMGIMVGGVTLANILGVPLGTAGGQLLGWQGPFWVLAGLSAAAALLLAVKLPTSGAAVATSLRREVASLRSGRLWVVYLTTALLQGSFIASYSYISPLLTERAGIAPSVVPLVMLGYGAGALLGTVVGARLGDTRPFVVLTPAGALIALTSAGIVIWGGIAPVVIGLFVLLGAFGLSVAAIVVNEAVRSVGDANTLAVALSTSSFNIGIAAASWLGGATLASGLGTQGPPLVGAIAAAAAVLTAIAVTRMRRAA